MAEPVNNVLYNSARWDGFPFRDGDIVISTPAKCGTTWTQRIVSLLIFDSPELDRPMARISPWVDMNTRPLDDVVAELDAQTHRRFMKSHLAFDLLPHDDRVTYITVGRDPRDVAISMANHLDNVDMEKFIGERIAAVGMEDLADMTPDDLPNLSGSPVERFWRWIEEDGDNGLEGVVGHLRSFWDHRDDPNVVLLHYADLQRDLVGQMAYLAERLGIERSRDRLAELAPFASFDEMKSAAETTAPNGDQTFWKSTSDFFRNGTSGQWRALISDDDVPRYEKRLHELADGDLARWLETGSLG
jgi:aryl sulfotransferase